MYCTLMFVIGVVIGLTIAFAIVRHKKNKQIVGNLRLDQSDPNEPPYMFLELEKSVNQIVGKKEVVLRVKLKNFI